MMAKNSSRGENVEEPVKIVQASGEIDVTNVSELASKLNDAANVSPNGFVIDLSAATYIDSAGIMAIMACFRRLRNNHGRLSVVLRNPSMKRIFDVIRIGTLPGILICDDLPSAEQFITA